MNNYVYIVAGLPELALSFENSDFSYSKVKEYFYTLLSEKDRAIVDLMEEGFNEETLGEDFYTRALSHSNRFIRDYFRFDMHVRNMKVLYLSKRLDKNPEQYLVKSENNDFEEMKQVETIFENMDFVAREQQMDKLRWTKVNELVQMDYFNMNTILAFLVKAKLVQRWSILDKEKGREMFEKLVKEIQHN